MPILLSPAPATTILPGVVGHPALFLPLIVLAMVAGRAVAALARAAGELARAAGTVVVAVAKVAGGMLLAAGLAVVLMFGGCQPTAAQSPGEHQRPSPTVVQTPPEAREGGR